MNYKFYLKDIMPLEHMLRFGNYTALVLKMIYSTTPYIPSDSLYS